MNIGVDIRPLMVKNKTGIGEYTLELLSAIFEEDKNNEYYLFSNSLKKLKKNLQIWRQPNVHYIHSPYPNKLLNFAFAFRFIDIGKLLPIKIDCWYSPNMNFLSLGKIPKYILTIHDISFEIFPEFYTFKQRMWHKIINPKKQCQLANTIIVPSENTKRDIIEYYKIDKNKIKVIYPGLSAKLDLSENELKLQKNTVQKKYDLPSNFILFLGSIEPRKNILSIIQAFEKLPNQLTEKYHLIITGGSGWKNKKIYHIAEQSKLHKHIKFLGFINDADKLALLSLSKLFVFPSFYEGFGFPIIEAMKMGVPVITSNRSSLPEISDNNALLINPNNISNISNSIKILLENSDLYNEYKKRGLGKASDYVWKNSANAHLTIFNN
jgi:glycosyltransferase involved in cell wall biosynthesis